MESMERDDAKSLIERYGGKVTASISKRTTYMVQGRDSGVSKLEKVTKLKIFRLWDEEFLKKICLINESTDADWCMVYGWVIDEMGLKNTSTFCFYTSWYITEIVWAIIMSLILFLHCISCICPSNDKACLYNSAFYSGGESRYQDPGWGQSAGADQNQTRKEVQVRDRCRGRGQRSLVVVKSCCCSQRDFISGGII